MNLITAIWSSLTSKKCNVSLFYLFTFKEKKTRGAVGGYKQQVFKQVYRSSFWIYQQNTIAYNKIFRVDLRAAPSMYPLIFAETGVHPLIFAKTVHLTVCGCPGAAAFLL